MAYNEELAARVRRALANQGGVTEKRMFGGLTFMFGDHMCCGVVNEDLVARLGPQGADEAITEADVREMDFTGRPLKGFVYVGPDGLETDAALRQWVDRAVAFCETLPAKKR